MLGAIYGDIVESRFELSGFNEYDFPMFHPSCHFADDTLMTLAVAIFMARTGKLKEEIKSKMISYYPGLADMSIAKLKASGYGLDELGNWVTCQGRVPQAICAFIESTSFEDAIRKAISLGANSDTQAAITGSIVEAYYGLTYYVEDKVMPYLPEDLQSIYFAFDLIKKRRAK